MNQINHIADQLRNTMPDEVLGHYQVALSDLYQGPHSPDYWRDELDETCPDYSFTASCKVVADWWENDADVPSYCDEDGYPQDLEFADQCEREGVRYYTVDRADVKRQLFGALASYL